MSVLDVSTCNEQQSDHEASEGAKERGWQSQLLAATLDEVVGVIVGEADGGMTKAPSGVRSGALVVGLTV